MMVNDLDDSDSDKEEIEVVKDQEKDKDPFDPNEWGEMTQVEEDKKIVISSIPNKEDSLKIDEEKIKSIMSKITIKAPDWAKELIFSLKK